MPLVAQLLLWPTPAGLYTPYHNGSTDPRPQVLAVEVHPHLLVVAVVVAYLLVRPW